MQISIKKDKIMTWNTNTSYYNKLTQRENVHDFSQQDNYIHLQSYVSKL